MSETKTYPLRLPLSLKKVVGQQSKEDGTSINQFFVRLSCCSFLKDSTQLEEPLAVAGIAHAAADEERAHGGFGQEA
jgi:hypothetical protein